MLAVLHIDTMKKHFYFVVIQHQAQNLIINHALDLFGGAAQQFFHIQDRGTGFASDFVFSNSSVSAWVRSFDTDVHLSDSDGQARGRGQDILLIRREVIDVTGFECPAPDAFACSMRHGLAQSARFRSR